MYTMLLGIELQLASLTKICIQTADYGPTLCQLPSSSGQLSLEGAMLPLNLPQLLDCLIFICSAC